MKTVTINLYSFNELNEDAKELAIQEHANFLVNANDFGSVDELGQTEEFTEDEVIENIEANDYLFYYDGELAHCTTYTKTGITEFHFHKQILFYETY